MNPETERYSTTATDWQNEPAYRLRDEKSGAEALIIPGLGANCVAWAITHQGQRLEVLETPPTPEDLRTHRYRGGIPVLWPFPGRVREARYNFEGVEYHLPRTDKKGVHHIHGVVVDAQWRVGEYGPTAEGARLVLSIGPEDLTEAMRAGYPFDFGLSLTFTLSEQQLTLDTKVENRSGEQTLPFGYGLHPYFRAPLIASETTPDRTTCPVLISAATLWPTEEGLPSGSPQALSSNLDFQEWRPLGPNLFDHMYSNVNYNQDGWSVAGYRDPGAGLEVQVQADANFHDWVLFTQPNRPSVCIEPYTCPPNAINFKEEGLTNGNLLVLNPASSWQARVILQVISHP